MFFTPLLLLCPIASYIRALAMAASFTTRSILPLLDTCSSPPASNSGQGSHPVVSTQHLVLPVASSFALSFASALLSVGIQQHDMKQKIVIKVSMASEKSRSKVMSLVARADGVSSMGIIGDGKDRLEVVGVDVDTVCLVMCLRKKLGYADILQVDEVKDKKPEEKQQPEKPKVVAPPPYYCPSCYYGYYCPYHHHH